ncbi:MAG: protein tyrosine phosphatase family protein [Pseudomonadales bacterium]|nr:protein tyrosine phosphatase family protein [Pseudomonadales bacterium]MBO6595793.1 protein tyrosine phosphatase family protein [Pseudomonadales bacterium]MBO6822277.1 protein tyrosine phosphatase family protein [Pseudomonadales bacterium]
MADAPLNYHRATPEIATSGQPDRAQIHRIADEGYEAVINLAMHDSENAIPEEGSLVASLGMYYFNIPVPFDEPTPDHLREFMGLMDVLAGKKVWVHCAVNARVSAFMYHYLTKKLGADEEAATSPLLAK